ncbi:MAG: hypothetical protein IKU43_09175 [Clostridia bacterium]|nr:hypothetical protein [Clostridia bacterium]
MKEFIKQNARAVILILAVLVGIMIILLSDKEEADTEATLTKGDLELYADELEGKLVSVIEGICGAESASVMITFESSFEKVYAGNIRQEENGIPVSGTGTSKTTEKQIVLAGLGTSGEKPILLKEICPRVKGVAVVCKGAGDGEVERKIKEAISVLFGIADYKVYVTEGK